MSNNCVQFTSEECFQILKNSVQNENNIEYVNHVIKSLKGSVEGYLSEHYSFEIHYKSTNETEVIKVKQFFVKCDLNKKGFLEDLAKSMSAHGKEIFIYNQLFVEYEKNLKFFEPFAPKYYMSDKSKIMLEDLTALNFHTLKSGSYTLNHYKLALETLARFHAYGFIYEECQSNRLDVMFPNEFRYIFDRSVDNGAVTRFLNASLESIIAMLNEFVEFQDKKRFKQLLYEHVGISPVGKYRKTCVHGDLWSNNVMFNPEISKCYLIDFQLMRYHYPAFDFQLFLYANALIEFRLQHEQELRDYYYECFSSVMKLHGINANTILSKEDFLSTCVLAAPDAKAQAFCDIALLHLPQELLMNINISSELYEKVLVTERNKYMVDIYRENPEFRKLANKELTDLYELLCLLNVKSCN